jgi:hypothetical protein
MYKAGRQMTNARARIASNDEGPGFEGLVVGHKLAPSDRDYVAPKPYIRPDAGQIVKVQSEKKMVENTSYGRRAITRVLNETEPLMVEDVVDRLGIKKEQMSPERWRTVVETVSKTLSALSRYGKVQRVKLYEADTHGPVRTGYKKLALNRELSEFMMSMRQTISDKLKLERVNEKLELLAELSKYLRERGGVEFAEELKEVADFIRYNCHE